VLSEWPRSQKRDLGHPLKVCRLHVAFERSELQRLFPPVLTGVMRERAPIDILYENSALSYRVSIGIAE
jgi:hypothetical protein